MKVVSWGKKQRESGEGKPGSKGRNREGENEGRR